MVALPSRVPPVIVISADAFPSTPSLSNCKYIVPSDEISDFSYSVLILTILLFDVETLTLPAASVSVTVNSDVLPFSVFASEILVVRAGVNSKLFALPPPSDVFSSAKTDKGQNVIMSIVAIIHIIFFFIKITPLKCKVVL